MDFCLMARVQAVSSIRVAKSWGACNFKSCGERMLMNETGGVMRETALHTARVS
jgi:hypothetical protein